MKNIKSLISKQELKVLDLVSKGFTSEKIGEVLAIAKSTVQTHRRNMLKKTGAENTLELIGCCYREKLLK